MLTLNSSLHSVYHGSPVPMKTLMATAYSLWSSRLKYGGAYEQWRTLLDASQWWDAGKLQDYQLAQLSSLTAFVWEHCPFYRSILQERGIRVGDLQSLTQLMSLPVIDKAVVRANFDGIRTPLARSRALMLSTSGTTGMALHVPMAQETFQREYAFRWQFQSAAGARKGDRFAYFTGHHLFLANRRRSPFWIRNHADGSVMFSLYHMADDTLAQYVAAFNRFAPAFVSGYPSGLYTLASFAIDHGLTMAPPRAVFTASEMLHDHQRATIERAFGAPVFQWFGQVETTVNLHECDQHRLHVKEEYGLLELIREDGSPAQPGEMGKVIGTGWGNPAFPLIRYDTGDNMTLAIDQTCLCGRGGRIIEKIWGRDEDFVITPEGRYVGRLDFVFKPVDTVKESQIVQEDADNICVRVVPLAGYSARDEQLIAGMLRGRVGDSMKIRFEMLESIPRQANGKMRYVVSHVAHGRRGVA
jgi:phenylacetate-CoA ligase